MSNMSLTYIGVYVVALVQIAKYAGIELSSDQATQVVEAVLTVVGIVAALYGRFRAGGVSLFGWKSS